jgi:hypothetical protein
MCLPLPCLQTLGIIYGQKNDLNEALRYQTEAIGVARGRSPLATFFAHAHVSAIKGWRGDHTGALADLDRLAPLAATVGGQYPAYSRCLENERAVELNALGRTEEAKHAVALALASPFAALYPEWHETRYEIDAHCEARKGRKPTSSPVAVSSPRADLDRVRGGRSQRTRSERTTSKTFFTENCLLLYSIAIGSNGIVPTRTPVSPILERYTTSARTRGPPHSSDGLDRFSSSADHRALHNERRLDRFAPGPPKTHPRLVTIPSRKARSGPRESQSRSGLLQIHLSEGQGVMRLRLPRCPSHKTVAKGASYVYPSSETPKPLCKKCRGTGIVPLCPSAELPTESGVFCPDCETGRQRWKAVLKFVDEIETKRPRRSSSQSANPILRQRRVATPDFSPVLQGRDGSA